MPYSQNVLTNIFNVNWGGKAAFVIGTFKGGLYYCSGEKGNFVLQKVSLPIEPLGDEIPLIRGSSHALVKKPGAEDETEDVFLVCGQFAELQDDLVQFRAFICSCNDGISWAKVYQGPAGSTPDTVGGQLPWASDSYALVRQDDSFYFDMWMSKSSDVKLDFSEHTFSSVDGQSWGQISEGDLGKSTFQSTYCVDNNCFDVLDQHVPDGIMHDDDTAKILMRPNDPPAIDYSGTPSTIAYWTPINIVEIVRPDAPMLSVSIPGLSQVTCVAGNGSTWMAGGWNDENGDSGAVVMSFDGGETWSDTASVDSGVVTLSAAPKKAPEA